MRVAVIGVGHLGRHHARILASLPDVTLAAVVDTNRARAAEIAAEFGATAYGDARDIDGRVEAVVIATPTESHASIAERLLDAGVHMLIEKPITQTVEEADRVIAAALRSGAVLAVGHSERFNPAVMAARAYIKDPRFIEVHRLGTMPGRSLDIDVVLDLMIHDLDLILSAVPSEIDSVEAVGVPVLTPKVDIANARLRFKNGCIANLTASRISREQVRKVRFFQRESYVSIDTASKEVEMYHLIPQPGALPTIGGGKQAVPGDEPLKRELEDFIAAIREGRAPAVAGEQGRAALALAVRIVELMRQ
ncbi:MAG TPA: Gfo/Idh/MocA family oxidoreductase [Vicinamibacterales bacterium]|nr:Gfo/Idh/MocA family oxidoreductase [Vicinamibacterales bacterium]